MGKGVKMASGTAGAGTFPLMEPDVKHAKESQTTHSDFDSTTKKSTARRTDYRELKFSDDLHLTDVVCAR